MNYEPAPVPSDPKQLTEYLTRELRRFGSLMRDESQVVHYRTIPANQGSLTAGVSANWKIAAGNIIRISASATVTLTGLAHTNPNREIVLINVGTASVVLKNEGTESSSAFRFALPLDWHLSANASAVLWYDSFSFRWRGLCRT